jgi:hypothetical protein
MEDNGQDNLETCEMCEFAQVRYIHIMMHDDYPSELRVGCYCAERMEIERANVPNAPKREADFKRDLRKQQKAAQQAQQKVEIEREAAAGIAADLTWVDAADRIQLAHRLSRQARLSEWEEQFVADLRARMERSSHSRYPYHLLERQIMCFRRIYIRIFGKSEGEKLATNERLGQ